MSIQNQIQNWLDSLKTDWPYPRSPLDKAAGIFPFSIENILSDCFHIPSQSQTMQDKIRTGRALSSMGFKRFRSRKPADTIRGDSRFTWLYR